VFGFERPEVQRIAAGFACDTYGATASFPRADDFGLSP